MVAAAAQWRVEKKENALRECAVTIYCYLRAKKLLIEHKNIFLVLNFYHFFFFFFDTLYSIV